MSDFTRSFIETLHRYERPLLRYALSFHHNIEDARDMVQDVFIKYSQSHDSIDKDRVAPWLFTVCRNRAIDHQRKNQRLTIMDPDSIELQTEPSSEPDPSVQLERSETSTLLLQLIEELPERQQEAVKLKFVAGLDYKQISLTMNTTMGNVGYLIHHGIVALRKKWLTMDPTHPISAI